MVSPEEHAQTLVEELEVLESIYLDELEKVSEEHLKIKVVPEEYDEAKKHPVLSLEIKYTPEYPDAAPNMRVLVLEDEEEQLGPAPADQSAKEDPEAFVSDTRPGVQELTQGMDQVASESLGMPMVFTLASHLREALTDYLARKVREADEAASRKRDEELEAEAEKFRGTAVTAERFREWRIGFERELAEKRERAEAEMLSRMSSKERDEYRRAQNKPSGRQLFSKEGQVEEEKDTDDSVKEVDWSLYSREQREQQARDEPEQAEGLVSMDSDED